MLIPSAEAFLHRFLASLSRRVNANSQHTRCPNVGKSKLIKKGEC